MRVLQSPYACTFGTPKVAASNGEGKHFKLSALGKAVRRRDIPTLAQQKAEEREAAGAQEEVSPEGGQWRRGDAK